MRNSFFGFTVVSVGVLLAACGRSNSPLTLSGVSQPSGSYQVSQVLCDGQPSTTDPSSLLNSVLTVVVNFSGSSPSRVTTAAGCQQTIPYQSLTFSSGAMNITEGPATCTDLDPGACASLPPSVCNTQPFSYSAPYQMSGSSLSVTIPPNPNTPTPCGAGQGTDTVVFVMNKTS